MKRKTHITRKNFIALSLVFFFCLMSVIAAIAIDATNPVFKRNNPVQSIIGAFGFPQMYGSLQAYIMVIVTMIYVMLISAAIMYEVRLAKYYGQKANSKKWWGIYLLSFAIGVVLCEGICLAAQYPYSAETIKNAYLFLAASALVGLLIFLALSSIVFAICALYINFKHIDEPYKFFGNKFEEEQERAEEEFNEEIEKLKEQGELANAFGEATEEQKKIADAIKNAGLGAGGNGGAGGSGTLAEGEVVLKERERVFPGLCTLDLVYTNYDDIKFEDNLTLAELCVKFRNYLAKVEKLYYEERTIRTFIAGLAASRLIILEGLSGTGKSSLARYFSEFISEKSYFEAVQATWRDRTSILGYYNDFSRSYNETEFLKRLYEMNYKENHINIMVLDELNISRIEYYFADFLSVMEYPMDEWRLKIMQLPYDFEAPEKLQNGIVTIPHNTWFIGTANKDDSTFTITDKVYDRAITISFDDRNDEFEVEGDVSKITLSYDHLTEMFGEAIDNKDFNLNAEDLEKFRKLTDFTSETFDLTFGNRIMNQIYNMVPVYVACGGTKEEALDFMFARKVIFKLEGRFEDYIKDGLLDLKSLIEKTYSKGGFELTKKEINRLVKKL